MLKVHSLFFLVLCPFLPTAARGGSFYDDFKAPVLGADWKVTDSGKLGATSWTPDHVLVRNGHLVLRHTLPGNFRGAEVEHKQPVLYGRLSARLKAGKAGGVLSTLFFYGEYSGKVHEIDIELFPDQSDAPNFTSYMDWRESDDYVPGPHYFHVQPVLPGFDCRQWHTYTIDWLKDRVVWYVDGKKAAETDKIIPFKAASIMMNTWHPDTWAKVKPDKDSEEEVDWVRWEALSESRKYRP